MLKTQNHINHIRKDTSRTGGNINMHLQNSKVSLHKYTGIFVSLHI